MFSINNMLNSTSNYTQEDLRAPTIETANIVQLYRANGANIPRNKITVSSETLDQMIQTRNALWFMSKMDLVRSNQLFDIVGTHGEAWARQNFLNGVRETDDTSAEAAKDVIKYRVGVCQQINNVLFRTDVAFARAKEIAGRPDNTPLMLIEDPANHTYVVRGDRRDPYFMNRSHVGDGWVGYPSPETYEHNYFQSIHRVREQYTSGASGILTMDDLTNAIQEQIPLSRINKGLTQHGLPTVGQELIEKLKVDFQADKGAVWDQLLNAKQFGNIYTDENGRVMDFSDLPRRDCERVFNTVQSAVYADFSKAMTESSSE